MIQWWILTGVRRSRKTPMEILEVIIVMQYQI